MGQKELLALLRPTWRSGERPSSGVALADAVARGLPREAMERVKHALALTDAEIATAIGMSPKSVSRIRKGPRHALNRVWSDRLYRLARIYALAKDVLEDDGLACEWLWSPQVGLRNRIPLYLLTTEAGAREVEDLLGRIEYGVVS
jgi:putative toxin-antitoxin system antitoxin component (TIGR02293 family)